jgi:hypothetical protein
MSDGAAIAHTYADAATDHYSPADQPASDEFEYDPAADVLEPAALDLNFDEPSTYNDEHGVGGGGGGVESGTGTVRDSSV